jgi:hypothetical protein
MGSGLFSFETQPLIISKNIIREVSIYNIKDKIKIENTK